jgi:endonuclease YncB( thermonuclease family)
MKKLTLLTCLILLIIFVAGCTQQPTGQIIGNQSNAINQTIISNQTNETQSSLQETLPEQYPQPSQQSTPSPTPEIVQPPEEYIVSYVIDGDTLVLTNGERVRLIGINAPESGQSCYLESKNKLGELVDSNEVTLEKDVSDKDMYGRLLRYVYVDSLFVNLEMVRLGYATAYEYSPDTKYFVQVANAENEAKTNQYGCLWKPSEKEECITIINFHYDAEGDDNYNLNDEYVTFKNSCSYPINMVSWTVKDEATHIYTFPAFSLGSEKIVTLYSGMGSNTATELYWGRSYGAVWNNDGDTLYLRDSNGNLVLSYSY